jgi:predicted amidophosphoribosyltransferase
VPPSKIKGDPGHDSRLIDTLRLCSPHSHEIVVQATNTQSRQKDLSPATRASNWKLQAVTLKTAPRRFVIFDDILTGGSHFAGMKIALARAYKGVPISGLFLARRILPALADPSK